MVPLNTNLTKKELAKMRISNLEICINILKLNDCDDSGQQFSLLLNNIAINSIDCMSQTYTKKILKLIVKQYINQYNPENSKPKQFFEASVLNNLASIYLQEQHAEKAVLYSEQAIQRIEQYIFSKIKSTPQQENQKDKQFIQDLTILLYGYMNIGRAIVIYKENQPYFQNLAGQQFSPTQALISSKSSPIQFYQNGYTISKNFLGKKHPITKKFYNLGKNLMSQEQEKGESSQRSYKSNGSSKNVSLWNLWNNKYDNMQFFVNEGKLQHKINRIYMIQRQKWQKSIKYQLLYQNNIQSMESSVKSGNTIKQQRRSSELLKNHQGDIFFVQQQSGNNGHKFQFVNSMQSSQKQDSVKQQQSNENSPLPTPNFIIKTAKIKKSIQKSDKNDDSLNSSRPITKEDIEEIMNSKLKEFQSKEIEKQQSDQKLQKQQEKLEQLQQQLNKLMIEHQNQQKDSQEHVQEIKSLKHQLIQLNQNASSQSMQASTPQNQQKLKKLNSNYSNQDQKKSTDSSNPSQLNQGQMSPQKGYQSIQQFQTQSSLTPSNSLNRHKHSQSPTSQNNPFPQIQNQLMAPKHLNQNPMNYSSQQMRRQSQVVPQVQTAVNVNPTGPPVVVPQSSQLHIHPDIFKQREIIVQKKVYSKEDVYNITICLSKNNLEHNFLISGSSQKTKKYLQDRTLQNDVLKYILAIVDLQDTMAHNQQIHTVTNFIDFCKFFMFPFICVEKDDQGQQKIEMHPKAFGIFGSAQQNWESDFLGEEVLLYLNYIENTTFRLVINNNKTGQVTRIDIQFDNTTFYMCFDVEKKEFQQRKQDIDEFRDLVKLIEGMETEKITQNKINLLSEKHNARKNNKVFDLDNLVIKDKQLLQDEILKILKSCEEHIIKHIAPNYRQYQEDIHFKYIKCYVYDSLKRARIFILREHTYNREYEIYVKNHHKTHGLKGAIINAEGSKNIPFQEFTRYFGVRQEMLSDQDKQMISSIFSNLFTLKEFHSEISEIDEYCYDENALVEEQIEVVCHEKYLYDGPYNYKSPIVCSFVGGQSKPFGIKVTIYDPVDVKEYGVFITVNEFKWQKDIVMESYNLPKKKKFVKQQVATESEITKNYEFTYFLQKVGWEPIQNSFEVKHNSNNYLEIKGKKNLKNKHQMIYRAEEIVNIEQFLNSLKEQALQESQE